MQNRGILITLRAAAILIIVTGLNDVVATAIPRYEPLYLYLAAVALVALTDGVLFGIGAALLAVGFYALLFTPRPVALSPALIQPAVLALAVAFVGAVIRGFFRSRRRKPEPIAYPVMPPLIETSAVAQVTDNAEVLSAIDHLRSELREAVAELSVVRSREGEPGDRSRIHAAELETVEMRVRQFEKDREWALKVAEEGRNRADRERGLRLDAERLLAQAREESSTMAGRLAELELSLGESERASAEAAELVNVLEELRRELNESRAAQRQSGAEASAAQRLLTEVRQDSLSSLARVAELELSLREAEKGAKAADRLLADVRTDSAVMAGRLAELERSLREAEKTRAELETLRRELSESRALLEKTGAGADATERQLVEARGESSAMAGRVAELELSLRETEKIRAEAERLRGELAENLTLRKRSEAGVADAERQLAETRAESSAMAGRVAELELSQRETEKIRAEVERLRGELAETRAQRERSEAGAADVEKRLAEARADAAVMAGRLAELVRDGETGRAELEKVRAELAEVHAVREQLEEEARESDKKLAIIVNHLATDHETDLGQALSDKEEARAEARALGMKLSALQKKHDDEAVRLREVETLLSETRAAAQVEIDRLRAAAPQTGVAPAHRPRVMIVHPDAELRSTASVSLERGGYEVVTAADGLEALRVAIVRQPDVVIAETIMPKMDGRELCQLLKSQEKTAHIMVVLLMRASDDAPRGDFPPDEILRKPVPVETLKATLANLLAPR